VHQGIIGILFHAYITDIHCYFYIDGVELTSAIHSSPPDIKADMIVKILRTCRENRLQYTRSYVEGKKNLY
jgi:hypothetical protein